MSSNITQQEMADFVFECAVKTLKPLVIYHDDCADGFGAAWAAWYKFRDNAEYLPMNYNDKRVELHNEHLNFPVSLAGRNVFILDFSFKPEIMDAMLKVANHITWIDHHKTAFEDNGLDPTLRHEDTGLDWHYILDPDHSGCVLAWRHFNSEIVTPIGLALIEDRDLWKWKLPNTRDFATGLRSEPFSFERFYHVMWFTDETTSAGRAMNKLLDQQLADVTKRPMPIDLYDVDDVMHGGLCINCSPNFSSEAGNILAKQSETFGMTWVLSDDGHVNVSLRSIGEFDVSKIARNYGGGGHRNASGFSVPFNKMILVGRTLIITK